MNETEIILNFLFNKFYSRNFYDVCKSQLYLVDNDILIPKLFYIFSKNALL